MQCTQISALELRTDSICVCVFGELCEIYVCDVCIKCGGEKFANHPRSADCT